MDDITVLREEFVRVQHAYIMANDPSAYVWRKLEQEALNLNEEEIKEIIGEED